MKPSHLIIATAAILASAACNAKNGDAEATGAASDSTPTVAVKPPANGDWSTVVTPTSAGGFMMGNPNAKAKLIEYGSLTCPHCRQFDEEGVEPLINKYVKSGKVAYEFRNYVRDPFDISASLIARCNGAKSFFPLERALYKDQEKWVSNVQKAPQNKIDAIQNMGPDKQFLEIAKLADLQKWAAMRGVPIAKSTTCLTDEKMVDQLVQMNSDATNAYPDFPGTPTFILNGKMVDIQPGQVSPWQQLEPKLSQAIGG
jgi:protein-disulfide isomerase